jgi:pimeloyl-ACP methyl ester carboxylesterase
MRRIALALIAAASGGSLAAIWACAKSDSSVGDDGGSDAPAVAFSLAGPCSDPIDAIYSDPGDIAPNKPGEILHCETDKKALSLSDVQTQANSGSPGYSGDPLTSGAKVYHVMYRTARGNSVSTPTPGFSSATVYVPDTPRAPTLPAIVASHAMTGVGPACTPSKATNFTQVYYGYDYLHLVYSMVGAGYPVIVPDLPGFASYGQTGNPPMGYLAAQDLAQATLDAARALQKMFSAGISKDVILVGHELGGAASLSALALSPQYAPELKIAGVAVYGPLWFSPRLYGGMFGSDAGTALAGNGEPSMAVWYHYTHGELLDGRGHGGDIFAPSVRDGIKKFIDTDCYAADYPELDGLGSTVNDLFDPGYVKAIENAVQTGTCDPGDASAACQTWLGRFDTDRPHITGNAARVPIFVAYGGRDINITPDLMVCAFDRLKTDVGTNLHVCYDPNQTGPGIVATQASHVNAWIAARTLGKPEPDPCPLDQNAITAPGAGADGGPGPVLCNPIVPND